MRNILSVLIKMFSFDVAVQHTVYHLRKVNSVFIKDKNRQGENKHVFWCQIFKTSMLQSIVILS